MRVRVRYPDGSSAVCQVADDACYAALRSAIQRAGTLPQSTRLLVRDFPPRLIELEPEQSIASAIHDGDTLILESAPVKQGKVSSKRRLGNASENGPSQRKSSKRPRGRKGVSLASSADASTTDSFSAIGADIVRRVDEKKGDSVTASLRASLVHARKEREEEACGERRYSAALSGTFEFDYFTLGDGTTTVFRVRYRPIGHRSWLEDPIDKEAYFSPWSKTLLSSVVQEVLTSDDKDSSQRELLRPSKMACCSPRFFWNMVRQYGADFEQGLRGLAPTADWSFLRTRKRTLSEKAKRNAAQAAEKRGGSS